MRLAYADPPYPGHAHLYREHADYGGEVDHAALFDQLAGFDGWALSTNNRNLCSLLALAPADVRVGAWCNPNSQPFAALNVIPSWEPVFYMPARKNNGRARVRDYLVAHSGSGFLDRGEHAIIGQKPPTFSAWVFDLLGAQQDDDLVDIFPGSGAVGRAWEAWTRQLAIPQPAPLDNEKGERLGSPVA